MIFYFVDSTRFKVNHLLFHRMLQYRHYFIRWIISIEIENICCHRIISELYIIQIIIYSIFFYSQGNNIITSFSAYSFGGNIKIN